MKPNDNNHLYHPDEELGFEQFDFSLNQIFDYFEDIGEPHTVMNMLPIATSSIHSGGICVCLNGKNIDKIFVNDEMSTEQFTLVANDILDFISSVKEFNYLED